MNHTTYEHVTWDQIEQSCLSMYARMCKDNYKPDIIIGVLKGGGIPASLFVDYFGVSMEFATLKAKSYDGIGQQRDTVELFPQYDIEDLIGKNVLVVDDIWDTGQTMEAILSQFKGKANVTTATIFYRRKEPENLAELRQRINSKTPNYYDKVIMNEWVVFPWEKYEFWRAIHGNKE